ncbi:MAG: hypothetical protein AAGD88_17855, partial [Bacteroidota bacterium]
MKKGKHKVLYLMVFLCFCSCADKIDKEKGTKIHEIPGTLGTQRVSKLNENKSRRRFVLMSDIGHDPDDEQ